MTTKTINQLKESYDSPSHFKKGVDAEYKAPKFAQARVVKGKSYGNQPDEEDPNKEVIDKPVKLAGDAPRRGRPVGSLGAAKKAASGMHGSALHDILMGKVASKLPKGTKRVVKFGESEEIVPENSITIDEAKKKIGEYTHEGNVTKVYKLSGEHNEGDPYKVELHRNGKHHEAADYFTNDHDDAHGTAKHMVKEDFESKQSAATLISAAKRYSNLEEMAMGAKKTSSGKKVEWTNHPGLGHSVTVDGVAAHHGFLDHAAASKLYAKHIAE